MSQPNHRQEEEALRPVSRAEMLAFVLRAARRHLVLSIGVGVVLATLATAGVLVVPPVYESNAKLFVAQSANLTAELSNPTRHSAVVLDPMKGLTETVYRRENLAAIVRETRLLEDWERTRSPVLRFKDRVMERILGPLSNEEKLKVLIATLENHITVWAEDGTSIRFKVEWRDPEMARKLTVLVKRNFLRARNASEHAAITTAIAIVEDELRRAAEAIEPALKEAQRARERHAAGSRSSSSASREEPVMSGMARPADRPRTDARSSEALTARLDEVRRTMREIKEPWQRRIAELRFQQAELRATYGPQHPSVIQQESKIQQASAEPPELIRLVQEERALLSTIAGLVVVAPSSAGAAPARVARAPSASAEPEGRAGQAADDPEISAAQARFVAALERYNELNTRLDTARLELTTAQAAFNYRYVTVVEAERSRFPVRPQRGLLLLAGLGASVLLAFAAGGLKEILSGRVVEAWQLKRLGLPVLAEVDLSEHRER